MPWRPSDPDMETDSQEAPTLVYVSDNPKDKEDEVPEDDSAEGFWYGGQPETDGLLALAEEAERFAPPILTPTVAEDFVERVAEPRTFRWQGRRVLLTYKTHINKVAVPQGVVVVLTMSRLPLRHTLSRTGRCPDEDAPSLAASRGWRLLTRGDTGPILRTIIAMSSSSGREPIARAGHARTSSTTRGYTRISARSGTNEASGRLSTT